MRVRDAGGWRDAELTHVPPWPHLLPMWCRTVGHAVMERECDRDREPVGVPVGVPDDDGVPVDDGDAVPVSEPDGVPVTDCDGVAVRDADGVAVAEADGVCV